jgi:hypothetical protein
VALSLPMGTSWLSVIHNVAKQLHLMLRLYVRRKLERTAVLMVQSSLWTEYSVHEFWDLRYTVFTKQI